MGTGARAATVAGFLALVVLAAVLLPHLAGITRENEARDKREIAEARAAQIAHIRVEQRPRSATASPPLLAALRAHIATDVRGRPGDLSPVRRVECESPDPASAPRRRYACTAVTSDVANADDTGRGVIGYPYRAVVDARVRRLTWCKISGQPGEGSFVGRRAVPTPRACGG
jgi:hypothetical protein